MHHILANLNKKHLNQIAPRNFSSTIFEFIHDSDKVNA